MVFRVAFLRYDARRTTLTMHAPVDRFGRVHILALGGCDDYGSACGPSGTNVSGGNDDHASKRHTNTLESEHDQSYFDSGLPVNA